MQPALVVADGETVQDLEIVVDALLELGFTAGGRRVVLVGTGGTADVLARRFTAQRLAAQVARNAQLGAQAEAATTEPRLPARPVLAVVGSASGTAQVQLAQLETRGFTVVRLHPLYAGAMGAYQPELAEVRQALAAGSNVAVTLAAGQSEPGESRQHRPGPVHLRRRSSEGIEH